MGNKKKRDDDRRREHDSRVAEGKRLAQALIGRSQKAALRRARTDGFTPEVLPLPSDSFVWVHGPCDLNRIALYVNDDHVVVDASAG